jgi:uncharacterized membrane protein YphA (DoxX/SURF4 family)
MATHQAERGIALLRIVAGFWILRSALSHLIWTPWPWAAAYWVQFVSTDLARHALDHPSFWVRYFIQQALLPNAEVYAGISVVLELLAGISLTFGLLTVPGALIGALLALVGGILTHYQSDLSLGFYVLEGTACLVFLFTRAGRRWGFDSFLTGFKGRAVLW